MGFIISPCHYGYTDTLQKKVTNLTIRVLFGRAVKKRIHVNGAAAWRVPRTSTNGAKKTIPVKKDSIYQPQ